ncbi:MAG: cysteine-rich CWC family protein [bacterium]|nr:cysteine-rich CWC family protein [bacterium]
MEVNKGICPICGKENGCAFQRGLSHDKCWCEEVKVPHGLLDQVPEELKRKACICRNCIEQFIQEQEQ